MAEQQQQGSTSFTVRRSLSQLSLAFAVIGFVLGILVMSPDGRFAGFSVMALGGTVPIVLGPSGYRRYGAIAAAIGTVGIIVFAGSGEGSVYRNKARVQAVYEYGMRYCAASTEHRLRTKTWPTSVASLDMRKPPRTVKAATFGPDGTITLVLSFPPVKDGALVFTPSGAEGPITWTCGSTGIEEVYLPEECTKRS
jgi:hypothetical protein